MNFPDLMEMRAWTIMFRHADLIWTLVIDLWLKTADHLRTPYPFSDPRFLDDPQGIANKHGGFENDPISNVRMERFKDSLTHERGLPVQWDITKDLGVNGGLITVLADPRVHSGQPYIKDTQVTLEQVVKRENKSLIDTAMELQITEEQAYIAHFVNELLHVPGWPIKDATSELGP